MNATTTRDPQSDIATTRRLASPALRITNWVLALLTLLGAALVVLYAYGKVLGTAACSPQTCAGLGPGDAAFATIVYGAPVVAIIAVGLSLFTARTRRGIIVPVVAWALLIAAFVVLAVTF